MKSEKQIEQSLVKAVKNMGGIAPKFVSPGFDGMPDRIVLLPHGLMAFVEVKAPGKKPRPLQVSRHGLLEELANAIVIQAAKDYMKALKKLKKYPRDAEARQMRNDCESFFRSSWYSALTSVDGELLMRKLQMEVAA